MLLAFHSIWEYLHFLLCYLQWMTFVVYVAEDLDSSPQVKMGKPFRLYASSPIGKIEIPAMITKHLYPSRVEFETKGTMMSVKSNFNIEDGEMAGFSKLTWKIHAKRKSYLYWVCMQMSRMQGAPCQDKSLQITENLVFFIRFWQFRISEFWVFSLQFWPTWTLAGR